jgi:hypothetical protein
MPAPRRSASLTNSDTLADILERVLETGIVIAGDIRVNLNDVELLTIQIRLIVCSVDKAREMGMDWWRHAEYLTAGQGRRLNKAAASGGPADAEGAAADGATADSASPEEAPGSPRATAAQQLQALDERLARLEKHMARLGDALDETSASAREAPSDAESSSTPGTGTPNDE